jgi:hypothetical protein
MSDAQAGLLVVAPILVCFSIALCRMGVLQRYSATIAIASSLVITAVLFMQQ